MQHRTFANIYDDKPLLIESFIRGNHIKKNTTKPSSDTTAWGKWPEGLVHV